MMKYFKKRLGEISNEYKGRDKQEIINAAGQCSLCRKKPGDEALVGPTHYLKKKIRITVSLHVHMVDGATIGDKRVVLCSACHMSWHLLGRLNEDAQMGNKRLGQTVYSRCKRCDELSCRCCLKCKKSPKRCTCATKKRKIKPR